MNTIFKGASKKRNGTAKTGTKKRGIIKKAAKRASPNLTGNKSARNKKPTTESVIETHPIKNNIVNIVITKSKYKINFRDYN